MKENKFYTKGEANLVDAALLLAKLNMALQLDLLLLEAEASVGLMDGLPLPGWEAEQE